MEQSNTRPNIITYLTVTQSVSALEFYQKAFGAEIKLKLTNSDNSIAHSELVIGNSRFGISENSKESASSTIAQLGGSTVILGLEVDDVDATTSKAEENGATIKEAPADQFYGARVSRIIDPYGYEWIISTTKEEMDEQKIQALMDEWANNPTIEGDA